MLLNRQKVLLLYLYLNKKECSRLHIIKALFLFCRENNINIYDFHPYIRWPFSELVYLDLRKLDEKWIIENWEYGVNIINKEIIKEILIKLDSEIIYKISNLINKYWNLSDKDLMDSVYEKYPYYAINNPNKKIYFKNFDPRNKEENKKPIIFTIWYEWITIDKYIDILIENNVNCLVDIRKNPNSMKYWFSSVRLKSILEKRWINYILIKELWINWEDRKELVTYNDYKILFEEYKKSLPDKEYYIKNLLELLNNWKRIALTCFEADYNYCHRSETSDYLYNFANKKYELKHL